MNIDLDQLNESQLLDLHRRIVERLRLLHQAQAQMSMLQFQVGDRVRFQADARGFICGTLIRHNKKSVTIRTDDGGQWRVSPGMLHPVQEPSTSTSAKVIELPRKS